MTLQNETEARLADIFKKIADSASLAVMFILITNELPTDGSYLPKWTHDVCNFFCKSMKEAYAKTGLVNTMIRTIEMVASHTFNAQGYSSIACIRVETEALKELSSTLFKNTDAVMIPTDFSKNIHLLAKQHELAAKPTSQSTDRWNAKSANGYGKTHVVCGRGLCCLWLCSA